MSFEKLKLNQQILTNVKFQGYVTPTPIQLKAIPVVLSGKDILAGAQTGTGKTAAFTLPILNLLSEEKPGGHNPKVLILTPTRELAAQIGENLGAYSKGLALRSTIIFGGVGINPQIQRIKKGLDIIIATPGRLLDLMSQEALNLSQIKYLVLDEADRMLDMGFIHDIRKIMNFIPKKRQTLFFSATYSKEIKALADTILINPVSIEVARQNTAAETVDQCYYRVAKTRKRTLLTHLINSGDWHQVLVFTKTKHGANRLSVQLGKDEITATAIHGNKSQGARTKALKDFKENKVRVLVATDIAARGLDIDRLPHVINYDLPLVAEDYVHRIGRTGRAGCEGEAVSLVTEEELKLLKNIEKLMKKKIPFKHAKGFSDSEKALQHNEKAVESSKKRQQDSEKTKPKRNSAKKKPYPWWKKKKAQKKS